MKYHTTIGLLADVPGYEQRKLVKIAHLKRDDGKWEASVISARNLSTLRKCKAVILEDEEIRRLFDNDEAQEFKNLAGLFGITV